MYLFIFVVLEIEPRASHMLHMHSTRELHPRPSNISNETKFSQYFKKLFLHSVVLYFRSVVELYDLKVDFVYYSVFIRCQVMDVCLA